MHRAQVSLQESPPWSKSKLCPQSLGVPASRSELEREGGSRKGRRHTFVFAPQNAPDGLKISWDLSVSILVRRPEDGARTSCARLCCRVTLPSGARETEACFLLRVNKVLGRELYWPAALLFPSEFFGLVTSQKSIWSFLFSLSSFFSKNK